MARSQKVTILNNSQLPTGLPMLIERTITCQPLLEQIHSLEPQDSPKQLTKQNLSLATTEISTLVKRPIRANSEKQAELTSISITHIVPEKSQSTI